MAATLSREDHVYLAKLAEQAERYEGMSHVQHQDVFLFSLLSFLPDSFFFVCVRCVYVVRRSMFVPYRMGERRRNPLRVLVSVLRDSQASVLSAPFNLLRVCCSLSRISSSPSLKVIS